MAALVNNPLLKYFLLAGRGRLETSGADGSSPEDFIFVLPSPAGGLHHHQRQRPLRDHPGRGEGVEHQAQPPPGSPPLPAWTGGHDGDVQARVLHSHWSNPSKHYHLIG